MDPRTAFTFPVFPSPSGRLARSPRRREKPRAALSRVLPGTLAALLTLTGCTVVHVHVPDGAREVRVASDGSVEVLPPVASGPSAQSPYDEPFQAPPGAVAPLPSRSQPAHVRAASANLSQMSAVRVQQAKPSQRMTGAPPRTVEPVKPMDGPWTELWPNGKVRQEGRFHAGKESGTWKTFDPEGRLVSERKFVQGRVHGVTRTYHPNGQVAEESVYNEGRDCAPTRGWYPDGTLAFVMPYTDGVRSGEAVWYHEDGSVRARGHYEIDLLHGVYEEYDRKGNVTLHEVWDRNVLTGPVSRERPQGTNRAE